MMSIKKSFLLLSMILLTVMNSPAQAPSWIDPETRVKLYPESKFLTGFTSQPLRKTDNLQEVQKVLLSNARTQLVESILVSIRSEATLNMENRNAKTLEVFKQASTMASAADLTGLKTNEWYDTKKKIAYAFVVLNIQEYLSSVRSMLSAESAQLSKKIEAAREYNQSGNHEQAMKTYYSCFTLLRDMEGKTAILLTLGKEGSPDKLDDMENQVTRGMSELHKSSHAGIDELCFFITDGLKQQLGGSLKSYNVVPGSFTYMDSRMASDFSVQLMASLQTRITAEGFTTVSLGKAIPENEPAVSLSGTYWIIGNSVKVIANLTDDKSGKTLASVEDQLPLSWLTSQNIKYQPENYQNAIILEKELSKDEVSSTGISAKLWTNKGVVTPVYKKDEVMKVYVQVNQPCYVRLIYFLADGRKALLLDSRYIDEDKVNKPYLIPLDFVCDAPFGAEVLQMVAQTDQFKPLNIKSEEGYSLILNDDRETIATTRGMKALKPAMLIAEKRINITTVEK